MGTTSITMTLSPQSIDKAIVRIKQYRQDIINKTRLLAQRLAERGVLIAQAQIYDLDAVFTTELYHSITEGKEIDTSTGSIFFVGSNCSSASFVEFGTGMVGKRDPYPYDFPDGMTWDYASGKTIRQLADGRYGWFYFYEGRWYFTEGMPSRPFLHNTSMELFRIVNKVAREVFR